MKKGYILSFIFGVVITASIVGVYAINASEIDYKETDVESALDTLYERSNYTEYSGNTETTPTTRSQTLLTKNKLLKSNITINAIPNTFKELNQTTTVTANNLLTGETAYNNLGELITGTINAECVSGSITCTSCTTSTGQQILNYKPSIFMIHSNNTSNYKYLWYYNKNINSTELIILYQTNTDSTKNAQFGTSTTEKYIKNNKFVLNNFSSQWNNKVFYYTACK